MRRVGFVGVAVIVATLGGCRSEPDRSSSPCEQFTREDARSLLDAVDVERVSYQRFVAQRTTEATTSEATAAARKLSTTTCAYQVGGELTSPGAVYQYGFVNTEFFSSEAKFLEANLDEGAEKVSGVGEAAVYSPRNSAGEGAAVTVLLSEGRNFVVSTHGHETPKTRLVAVAKRIADRV